MPLPWPTYREHVARAASQLIVSHRPDHGHQGALHYDTAYGLHGDGEVSHRAMLDSFKSGADMEKKTLADAAGRHGVDAPNGEPTTYKGYKRQQPLHRNLARCALSMTRWSPSTRSPI